MDLTVEECRDKELLSKLNRDVQELHAALYPQLFKPYSKDDAARFFDWALQQSTWKSFVAYANGEAVVFVQIEHRKYNDNPFRNDCSLL